MYLDNRRRGASRLTIYGGVEVLPTAADAEAVLRIGDGPRLTRCAFDYYHRTYSAETPLFTLQMSTTLPHWLRAPAGLHVKNTIIDAHFTARHMERGYRRIVVGVYAFQDAVDPNLVYAFEITALDRPVPQSVVRRLVSVAEG